MTRRHVNPTGTNRIIAAAATASLLLCGVAACGDERGAPPPVASAVGPSAGGDLDAPRPSDAAFFRRFHLMASWLPEPEGLAAGVRESTLVLTARVTGVRETRVLGTGDDTHGFVGVALEPVEILHGSKAQGLGEITVEFDNPDPSGTPALLADLRASLPEGQALWFLLWKGMLPPTAKKDVRVNPDEKAYYRLIHPFGGLAIQGPSGVVTPLADADHAPLPGRASLTHDVQGAGKLSSLAKAVKAQ